MPFSWPAAVRDVAIGRVRDGARPVDVARALGVSTTSVYTWLAQQAPELVRRPAPCWRCGDPPGRVPAGGDYAQLLGSYLGDGCISRGRAAFVLRITCDDGWPGVAEETAAVVAAVSDRRVQLVRKQGCHDVAAWWQHWPCVLPQHGPGKKHARPIVLEPWQRDIVSVHAGRFLRGLFHSDGWRGTNVAVRRLDDRVERRHYVRYEFTNHSADIRLLCTQALDVLGIAWRPNGPYRISVARRAAVAALDEHVGPKS